MTLSRIYIKGQYYTDVKLESFWPISQRDCVFHVGRSEIIVIEPQILKIWQVAFDNKQEFGIIEPAIGYYTVRLKVLSLQKERFGKYALLSILAPIRPIVKLSAL